MPFLPLVDDMSQTTGGGGGGSGEQPSGLGEHPTPGVVYRVGKSWFVGFPFPDRSRRDGGRFGCVGCRPSRGEYLGGFGPCVLHFYELTGRKRKKPRGDRRGANARASPLPSAGRKGGSIHPHGKPEALVSSSVGDEGWSSSKAAIALPLLGPALPPSAGLCDSLSLKFGSDSISNVSVDSDLQGVPFGFGTSRPFRGGGEIRGESVEGLSHRG